jgi:hypothetical protein
VAPHCAWLVADDDGLRHEPLLTEHPRRRPGLLGELLGR